MGFSLVPWRPIIEPRLGQHRRDCTAAVCHGRLDGKEVLGLDRGRRLSYRVKVSSSVLAQLLCSVKTTSLCLSTTLWVHGCLPIPVQLANALPDLNCPFNDLPGQYIRGDTERAHHIGLSLAACGLDCFEASTGNSSPFGRIDQLHIEPNRGDRFSAAVFELERPQRTAQLHIGAHWGAIGNHGSRPPIAHEGFDDSVAAAPVRVGPTHLPSRQATIGLRNEQPLRIQDATTLRA